MRCAAPQHLHRGPHLHPTARSPARRGQVPPRRRRAAAAIARTHHQRTNALPPPNTLPPQRPAARRRRRSGGYLYYIYTADDAEMEEVLDFGINTGDPYRTFER